MQEQRRTADPPSLNEFWAGADAVRRAQGRLADQLGFGPQTTPARTVGRWPAVDLLAYQAPNAEQPVLLAVPAPIKAAYIWDLSPEVSVVRRCLTGGMQVYLMVWQRPQPSDAGMGLDEYADRAIRSCLQAASGETGQTRVFLAGHSLGGTLTAIFASLYPERLHGLIELEGPIEFDAKAGRLEALVADAPRATTITRLLGNVPGTFLDVASSLADPVTFNAEPWIDWMKSCFSPATARTYGRVRRWTLDETPMPRHLFEEVTDALYRENRFAEGTLRVGGRPADPRALTAPVLAVMDPRSRIVPAAAGQAYRERTASKDVEMLEYRGDTGVMLQHVGVLVGENAHRSLWPEILRWVRRHFPRGAERREKPD